MVYAVQSAVLMKIKEILPNTKYVTYFSDGCGGQYKNRKNFYNLCQHYDDFKLHAKWVFFATSRGKQPCDGIGGTVKRLTRLASLGRPRKEQILTPQDMFKYCNENIKGIHFVYIEKTDLQVIREQLEKRFENIKTLPGTRSFHEF